MAHVRTIVPVKIYYVISLIVFLSGGINCDFDSVSTSKRTLLELIGAEYAEEPLYFVTREEWGALPFTSSEPVVHPVNHVRVQCTGEETCEGKEECSAFVRNLQKEHMEKYGLPDIQYNFLISSDGWIFEGRGWFRDAYRKEKHDFPLKNDMINVGYIGDYRVIPLPMKLEAAAVEIAKYGLYKEYISTDVIVYNHKFGNIDFTFF